MLDREAFLESLERLDYQVNSFLGTSTHPVGYDPTARADRHSTDPWTETFAWLPKRTTTGWRWLCRLYTRIQEVPTGNPRLATAKDFALQPSFQRQAGQDQILILQDYKFKPVYRTVKRHMYHKLKGA